VLNTYASPRSDFMVWLYFPFLSNPLVVGDGLKAIGDGIAANTTVTELRLGSQQKKFSTEAEAAFVTALEGNTTIVKLALEVCVSAPV
jgi:hypothetical protein